MIIAILRSIQGQRTCHTSHDTLEGPVTPPTTQNTPTPVTPTAAPTAAPTAGTPPTPAQVPVLAAATVPVLVLAPPPDKSVFYHLLPISRAPQKPFIDVQKMQQFYRPFPVRSIEQDNILASMTIALVDGTQQELEKEAAAEEKMKKHGKQQQQEQEQQEQQVKKRKKRGLTTLSRKDMDKLKETQLKWLQQAMMRPYTPERPDDLEFLGRETTWRNIVNSLSCVLGSAFRLGYPPCLEVLMDGCFVEAHFYALLAQCAESADNMYRQCLYIVHTMKIMVHVTRHEPEALACKKAWKETMARLSSGHMTRGK